MKRPKSEYSPSSAEPTPLNAILGSVERLNIIGKCYGVAEKDGGYVAVSVELGSPGYELKVLSDAPERFLHAKKVALTELSYTEADL